MKAQDTLFPSAHPFVFVHSMIPMTTWRKLAEDSPSTLSETSYPERHSQRLLYCTHAHVQCSSVWNYDVVSVQLVKATRSFQGSSAETSVSEGELLVVKTTKSKITGIPIVVNKMSR